MPRRRTAKKLAQRIDINYFKKLHPFRRWRLLLSLAACMVAVAWLASLAAVGKQTAYSGGPVSKAHVLFGQQCALCHVRQAGVLREHATAGACLACHDAPDHNPRQTFIPACGSCHVEHKGSFLLARVSDQSCIECHGSLKTKSGMPQFEPVILGFNRRHPEFAVRRGQHPGPFDPGTIKFNHYLHLQSSLRGPQGQSTAVRLECDDCHRLPNQNAGWRFGEARFQTAAAVGWKGLPNLKPPADPGPPGGYMAPLQYAKHCLACHALQFDARFPESVPHQKPEVVHEFLLKKFSDYIAGHPQELRAVQHPERYLPGRKMEAPTRPRTASDWVMQRTGEAEDLLWRKTCKQCHTLEFAGGAALPQLPGSPARAAFAHAGVEVPGSPARAAFAHAGVVVAPPRITARWFVHAVFDHQPHRMLQCASCHAAALASRETSDVLLPGIAECQACHRQREGAENRCFECHQYHDWTKKKPVQGRFKITELVGSGPK